MHSWLNNVLPVLKTLVLFRLHYAHVRKDTIFSLCIHIHVPGELGNEASEHPVVC